MEQMIKTNAKFNVIAKCTDNDIKIGKVTEQLLTLFY